MGRARLPPRKVPASQQTHSKPGLPNLSPQPPNRRNTLREPISTLLAHPQSHPRPHIHIQQDRNRKTRTRGYCMEVAILFNHILRGLGFRTYMAGAKGRARKDGIPSGEFLGWVHIVSIVTFTSPSGNEERYASDVAFGGDGPCFPLPLDSSPEPPVFLNLGTQEVRIVHTNISQQLEPRHKFWVYQYRNTPTMEWRSFYAFTTEVEFTQADFEVMSYYTSTYREGTNWQPFTVLVVGFIREGEAIVGKKMLVDAVVKRNDGGKTKLVLVCKGEEERVRVLKEEFGIELTGEEVEGIRGTGVELKCNGS